MYFVCFTNPCKGLEPCLKSTARQFGGVILIFYNHYIPAEIVTTKAQPVSISPPGSVYLVDED